jgi:Ca2+/Na+ antiporter
VHTYRKIIYFKENTIDSGVHGRLSEVRIPFKFEASLIYVMSSRIPRIT